MGKGSRVLQGGECAVLWYPEIGSAVGQVSWAIDVPISRVVGELHRVTRTGVGSRDPTIRENEIEELVHVPHHDHVAINKDDPLQTSLSTAAQVWRRSYLKFHQTKSPAEHRFRETTKGYRDSCAPEFSPCVVEPGIEIREHMSVRSGLQRIDCDDLQPLSGQRFPCLRG